MQPTILTKLSLHYEDTFLDGKTDDDQEDVLFWCHATCITWIRCRCV